MALSTDELLEQFKSMTVLELHAFLTAFEEEFGVTAAAPVAVAAAAPAAGGGGTATASATSASTSAPKPSPTVNAGDATCT